MNDNICNRRTFLKGAGLMALAATGAVRIPESHAEEPVPWSSGTDLPKLKAPANSCDCHMHIYDAHFPADPGATLRPADALVDDYRRLQKRIGTTRNVVVTPSTYGTDNRVTLDAMAKFGATARGELERLLERRVHLFLFVKVREHWSEERERLAAIGLDIPET